MAKKHVSHDGILGVFFGHQWDPLGPITDAMTEIGILSGLFGSLTPLLILSALKS